MLLSFLLYRQYVKNKNVHVMCNCDSNTKTLAYCIMNIKGKLFSYGTFTVRLVNPTDMSGRRQ